MCNGLLHLKKNKNKIKIKKFHIIFHVILLFTLKSLLSLFRKSFIVNLLNIFFIIDKNFIMYMWTCVALGSIHVIKRQCLIKNFLYKWLVLLSPKTSIL